MAASANCTAFAMAGSTSCLDLATFSSKSAFGNVVQGALMARTAARVGGVRASWNNSEEARPARREVLAGILAAGAALGFSNQASAGVNPIAAAKSKAGQAVQGAKDLAGGNPLENVTAMNPLGDIEVAVDGAASGIKKRITGFSARIIPTPRGTPR